MIHSAVRVAVLDDYHRVFEADPAIQRLRGRLPVDVYTEKLPLDKLRTYPILVALRERTRFDAAFFAALPELELIAQTGNHAYHVDLAAATKAACWSAWRRRTCRRWAPSRVPPSS
jgi:phosphoglycerate dehydrogenase-like enzyme